MASAAATEPTTWSHIELSQNPRSHSSPRKSSEENRPPRRDQIFRYLELSNSASCGHSCWLRHSHNINLLDSESSLANHFLTALLEI